MNSLGWALRCCSGWHLDRTQSSDIRRRCTIGLEIGRAQSELQSRLHLVCRLLLEKKKNALHPGLPLFDPCPPPPGPLPRGARACPDPAGFPSTRPLSLTHVRRPTTLRCSRPPLVA